MDTLLTNSKIIKTSDPHRETVKLLCEMNLKRSDKYVALSNQAINKSIKAANLKYLLQYEMINLNYLIDYIL